MDNVRKIARAIVVREGGFVDDRDDPGGVTNRGITIGTARRLGLDLDGDGDIDRADVALITFDHAVEIYIKQYYYAAGIDRLPVDLQPGVFDMNVNAGSNAAKILQRLLLDFGEIVVADGVIGRMTAAAAHRVAASIGGVALADAYAIARRGYYYNLADHRPASRKYARRRDGGKGGWIVRAEEFLSPALRLTDAQHAVRVAKWA